MGRLAAALGVTALVIVASAVAATAAAPTRLVVAGASVSSTTKATRAVPTADGAAALTMQLPAAKPLPMLRAPRGAMTLRLRARRTESTTVAPANATVYEEPEVCRPPAAATLAAARLELRPSGRNVEVRLTLPGVTFVRCPGPRGVAPAAARVLVAKVPAAALSRPTLRVALAGKARVSSGGWSRSYSTRATVTLRRA